MTDPKPEHETQAQDQENPQIVVDDDYKNRVEQEKEKLKQEMESSAAGDEAGDQQMPPASFQMLVSTLATQALSSLGHLPDPIEGKPVVRKPIAKHFIDTLSVLEEKTKGNLTDEEKEMLNGALHQLRMAFVATPNTAAEPPAEKKTSSLELP